MFQKSQKMSWLCTGNLKEKSALLVLTFVLVLYLAEQLLKQLKYCIYLDNLFLNLSVTQYLLLMRIYCMDIMHKKAVRVPF